MSTYLLTWSSKYSDELQRALNDYLKTGSAQLEWSTGTSLQIKAGSRLFLMRQWNDAGGIIGSGFAVDDAHEGKSEQARRFVTVRFDRLVDPFNNGTTFLSRQTLNELIPRLRTDSQSSGDLIPDDIAVGVEQLWEPDRSKLERHNEVPEFSRDDVLEAIEYFRRYRKLPTFEASTGFDVIYQGIEYPPKILASLASRSHRGRMLFSKEFVGGIGTPCFARLEVAGFKPIRRVTTRPLPFEVGKTYSPQEIWVLLGLPASECGGWDIDHHREGVNTLIFATIGNHGPGHDSYNRWVGDEFYWTTSVTLDQENTLVQVMLNPPSGGRVYIFTREEEDDLITYEGVGLPVQVEGNRPVRIVWRLGNETESRLATGAGAGEVDEPQRFLEGATRKVSVNVYERNPAVRRACIRHYGCKCSVCGFDFAIIYGPLGNGFIHVHHLKPLAEIDGKYEVDPVAELRPVCPNCHAMLHANNPPLSIDELIKLIAGAVDQK